MSNSVRWALVTIFLAVNVLSRVLVQNEVIGLVLNGVSGIAPLGLLAEYLIRRRREH
ncbi:MAG TPA: hypothetical protein VIL71_12950 [Spirillospora sp.]